MSSASAQAARASSSGGAALPGSGPVNVSPCGVSCLGRVRPSDRADRGPQVDPGLEGQNGTCHGYVQGRPRADKKAQQPVGGSADGAGVGRAAVGRGDHQGRCALAVAALHVAQASGEAVPEEPADRRAGVVDLTG